MTGWRAFALAVFLLLPARAAQGTPVVVLFEQDEDCEAVVRWELLGARIDAYTPSPSLWDAALFGTISPAAASVPCGSPQRATVEVGGPGGPMRFWLRLVATSGVAVSGSVDAVLPRVGPRVPTTVVGGGGNAGADCLLVLMAPVNHPARRPREVRCTDGDPQCDEDGMVNGECTIPVTACVNSTAWPGVCISPGVESVEVASSDPAGGRYDPDYALLQSQIDADIAPPSSRPDACTVPLVLRLPLVRRPAGRGCGPARKKFKLLTSAMRSSGGGGLDRDKLAVGCWPSPAGC